MTVVGRGLLHIIYGLIEVYVSTTGHWSWSATTDREASSRFVTYRYSREDARSSPWCTQAKRAGVALHLYNGIECKKVMDGDVKSLNPLTKLWRIIDGSTMLWHGLSKWLKLAEVAIVFVLGSVEDERTFSTLSFMKDKLHNWLQSHLPMVVTMHGQTFFDINNFPYDQAYQEWKRSIQLSDEI
jgi:hypothetical protein